MSRERIIAQLEQEYARRREENQEAFEEKQRQIAAACPGLQEMLDGRRAMVLKGVHVALSQDGSPKVDFAARMKEYNEGIRRLLVENGFAENALEPVYHCPLCRDNGYITEPTRHMCECMQKELALRVMRENGLLQENHTFENFRPELFSDEKDDRGVSPRTRAQLNFSIGQRFAREYPAARTPNLLIAGGSGLGKTYLSQCIANELAKRGHLPIYITAYRLFEVERQAHIENRPELMEDYLKAPILLIDDLGTEPMMSNITVVQLFHLLNERQMTGRSTIISTNLTVPELRERYTERITSRWMDATSWTFLPFTGEDIRRKLGTAGAKA